MNIIKRAESQALKVMEETLPRVCQAQGQIYCSPGSGPITYNQAWGTVPSSGDILGMRKVA